ILLSKNAGPVEVDLLFVMDFAMQGGAFSSTMNYIHAALRAGRRVGVFHWRRYELDVTVPPRSEIRRLVHEGRVALISPDERVSGDTARHHRPSSRDRVSPIRNYHQSDVGPPPRRGRRPVRSDRGRRERREDVRSLSRMGPDLWAGSRPHGAGWSLRVHPPRGVDASD